MECVMGGSSGGSTSGGGGGGGSVASKEEVVEQLNPSQMVGIEGFDESELELGLGLSLGVMGCKDLKQIPRILTAKDLPSLVSRPVIPPPSPSCVSSCSSLGLRRIPSSDDNNGNYSKNNMCPSGKNVSAGIKRAASPTAASQVVGWPPIKGCRMNSMANQAKSTNACENSSQFEKSKQKDVIYKVEDKRNTANKERKTHKNNLLVKVNMDGVVIGRKVDLNSHSGYESLGCALEEMFINKASEKSGENELMLMPKVTRGSKLLDGLSEYVLTYEDKDEDWMLVGDVPWEMFISSVKRLRIMRSSEANGLTPRLEKRRTNQTIRPI